MCLVSDTPAWTPQEDSRAFRGAVALLALVHPLRPCSRIGGAVTAGSSTRARAAVRLQSEHLPLLPAFLHQQ